MKEENVKPVKILLVEDNEPDIDLTKEALAEFKMLNELYVVKDGVEAMSFLTKIDKYRNMPTPDLILLDLNLPKKNGIEVLAEIKEEKDLKKIPVVILTTSEAEEDILKSYELNASCYIKKPIDLQQFFKVVKSFGDFWFSIVRYPKKKK
ncbi:MAG: response regulator [Candidatus Lokiarchaeota archaeon]|nr:response regulator [Candidatus Lokiarchaeota archaeon]MBD3202454.1 response regulator [Candidatus Lokiarchaeota archaeon]